MKLKRIITNLWFSILASTCILMFSCSEDTQVSNEPDTEGQESEEQEVQIPSLNPQQAQSGVIRDITSATLVEEMGIGWNLGNSMDVEDRDKTFWGNPLPTKEMIDAIAERGFGTLRVPVTWGYHQGPAPNYAIETEFLDQIQEIVDYALANGMHTIINVHHDDPWMIPTYAMADEVGARLESLWSQVALRFESYGDYLIFETMNEPRHEGSAQEWLGGTAEGRDVVNQYHKISLDAIRATGGNNEKRHIMIAPYAAAAYDVTMNALVIPNDDTNIIVSIHQYFPFEFTHETPNGTFNWGSQQDRTDLRNAIDFIADKWVVQEKRPVVLGEWGTVDKNNAAARRNHAEAFVEYAKDRGMLPIWWDNGLGDEFGVFDRNTISWSRHDGLVDIILNTWYK